MKKINIIYEQVIKLFGNNHYLCNNHYSFNNYYSYNKQITINKQQGVFNYCEYKLGYYEFGSKKFTSTNFYNNSSYAKYYVPMNNKFGAFEYMENIEFINKKEDRRT